jgi:hypothetical protein
MGSLVRTFGPAAAAAAAAAAGGGDNDGVCL